MKTYMAEMIIEGVERPYNGSPGLKFTLKHRRFGYLFCCYLDMPMPAHEFSAMPFPYLGWFCVRDENFFAYCEHGSALPKPCVALQASILMVREYIGGQAAVPLEDFLSVSAPPQLLSP